MQRPTHVQQVVISLQSFHLSEEQAIVAAQSVPTAVLSFKPVLHRKQVLRVHDFALPSALARRNLPSALITSAACARWRGR